MLLYPAEDRSVARPSLSGQPHARHTELCAAFLDQFTQVIATIMIRQCRLQPQPIDDAQHHSVGEVQLRDGNLWQVRNAIGAVVQLGAAEDGCPLHQYPQRYYANTPAPAHFHQQQLILNLSLQLYNDGSRGSVRKNGVRSSNSLLKEPPPDQA